MYTYRLTELEFNEGTKISPSGITLLIGPNNAGKSRALRDIASITANFNSGSSLVISKARWILPSSLQELRNRYPEVERQQTSTGQWQYNCLNTDLVGQFSGTEIGTGWPERYESCVSTAHSFASHFGRSLVAFLTTSARLSLVRESKSPEDETRSANLLSALYNGERSIELEIRAYIKATFGLETALDFTVPQNLSLRVARNFGEIPPDPRDARAVLHAYEKIDTHGDGLKAFVAIAVALHCVKRPLFLVDEPEAFLHPPQAFRMGRLLGEQAHASRQIIAATHSADVLRGVLSVTRDVTIIRLDRVEDRTVVRKLAPERVQEIATDPLLASARVLDGLFYSSALVVEGESDARFYHSAFQKLAPELDLHVVNAANKQLVPRINSLYRDMGVRHAGIVDIDVLNDAKEFRVQMEALFDDTPTLQQLSEKRTLIDQAVNKLSPEERLADVQKIVGELSQALRESADEPTTKLRNSEKKAHQILDSAKSWRAVKRTGIAALPETVHSALNEVVEACASKGLFILTTGQLESMLTDYGIPFTEDKKAWIKQALTLLPRLEVDTAKQPWKLADRIRSYLTHAHA
jgi:predicted ATPase